MSDRLDSMDITTMAVDFDITQSSDPIGHQQLEGLKRYLGLGPECPASLSSRHSPIHRCSSSTTVLASRTLEKNLREPQSAWQSLRLIFLYSCLNLFLMLIPVLCALKFAAPESIDKDTFIFVFSFLTMIPLAKLLDLATEELSLRVGQTVAGLLNATLGNFVELIVAIIALLKCDLRIVQASLVGSILNNLLLVLGLCFFAGGIKYKEQGFGESTSQLNSSLLTISVIAVLLPASFHFLTAAQLNGVVEARDILSVSRGTAIILLVIYGGFLFFQLWSHATLYEDNYKDAFRSTRYRLNRQKEKELEVEKGTKNLDTRDHQCSVSEERVEERPQMHIWVALALLIVASALIAVVVEWLVDSIDVVTKRGGISREFVAIILLPMVGNAPAYLGAIMVSMRDKVVLGSGVAVASSIQTALFVMPFIVILGWAIGKPMTLLFDPYESIVLFFSVLTVGYVIQDGKSNWLEGFVLTLLYVILGVTFWFYPGSDPSGLLETCQSH